MRAGLFLILWILLGVLYWWIWGSNQATCCTVAGAGAAAIVPAVIDSSEVEEEATAAIVDEEPESEPEPEPEPEEVEPEPEKEVRIVETADKTLIYFPFNSDQKLNSSRINNYLAKVARRVKDSGETVNVSGHTDSIGNTQSNVALGQLRADKVKEILISLGVPGGKINATSNGESSPIASNQTRDGRAQNRRVELTIN